MTIDVTAPNRSMLQLRDLVDGRLVPRLLSVPGVADVNVFGGGIRQLQIQFDRDRLRRYDLSVAEVRKTAQVTTGVRGAVVIANDNHQFALMVLPPLLLHYGRFDAQRWSRRKPV